MFLVVVCLFICFVFVSESGGGITGKKEKREIGLDFEFKGLKQMNIALV